MPFSTGVGVRMAFVNTKFFTANQDVGRVKSIVDDFFVEQGTVSMRVAFVLRSAEVHPMFRDLCGTLIRTPPPSLFNLTNLPF